MMETNEKEGENLLRPASNFKRIAAFSMDFILLSCVSTLLFFYIPKMHGDAAEAEFERLSGELTQALRMGDSEPAKVERLMVEFSEFTASMNYELIMTLTFILYFLLGEIFFSGKSVGKATFSLRTSSLEGFDATMPRQLIIRSIIKGISCSFFLLGLANLLFFFFSRKHRCLHDLASRTSTVQS